MRMTVMLIHSGGFTSRQWKKLAAQLAPRRVLAPDLIGYAEPWPDGVPFHFERDVERLAGMLDDDPVDLVGHSYGGFLALQLALCRPVRSIAVYEPVAFGVFDEESFAIEAFDRADPDRWLRGFVEWWNGPGAWEALGADTKQAFRAVGWKLSEEVRTLAADRTGKRYAQITAPTLLLGGGKSPLAEQRVIDELARILPAATATRFPEMGHMGPITHAAIVNAAIIDFLSQAELRGER